MAVMQGRWKSDDVEVVREEVIEDRGFQRALVLLLPTPKRFISFNSRDQLRAALSAHPCGLPSLFETIPSDPAHIPPLSDFAHRKVLQFSFKRRIVVCKFLMNRLCKALAHLLRGIIHAFPMITALFLPALVSGIISP